mmetsp:Transcript_7995/g.24749  ORF Transcript_7995/g.24749 Transcript_7995/m.24749 type:complete len:259 (-) Transcript_7995:815-1591(-)
MNNTFILTSSRRRSIPRLAPSPPAQWCLLTLFRCRGSAPCTPRAAVTSKRPSHSTSHSLIPPRWRQPHPPPPPPLPRFKASACAAKSPSWCGNVSRTAVGSSATGAHWIVHSTSPCCRWIERWPRFTVNLVWIRVLLSKLSRIRPLILQPRKSLALNASVSWPLLSGRVYLRSVTSTTLLRLWRLRIASRMRSKAPLRCRCCSRAWTRVWYCTCAAMMAVCRHPPQLSAHCWPACAAWPTAVRSTRCCTAPRRHSRRI